MSSAVKVRVSPLQPHCFAFGGFEVQMISAMNACRDVGIDIQPLDPWSRDTGFDVLHLWGLEVAHLNSAFWANAAGKRVVLSALLPYIGLESSVRRLKSWLDGRARMLSKVLACVDALVVVNDLQAETALRMFGVNEGRIHIIPNIVEDVYFDQAPSSEAAPLAGDILCVGNICVRKKQVKLAEACIKANLGLSLVGDVLTGEAAYGEVLSNLVRESTQIRWTRGVKPGDARLVEEYKNARCVALISDIETQPISLLEAAAMRRPLLISDRPYAHQRYYENSAVLKGSSVSEIVDLLHSVCAAPSQFVPPREPLNECRREVVGRSYAKIYQNLS